MLIDDLLSQLPLNVQESPIIQSIIELLRSQTILTQKQSEQIVNLKQTVDELKDEIARLTKTPKRPKFRAGGMEPRNRSANQKPSAPPSLPRNTTDSGLKTKVEVRITATGIPTGSRFKGYSYTHLR